MRSYARLISALQIFQASLSPALTLSAKAFRMGQQMPESGANVSTSKAGAGTKASVASEGFLGWALEGFAGFTLGCFDEGFAGCTLEGFDECFAGFASAFVFTYYCYYCYYDYY